MRLASAKRRGAEGASRHDAVKPPRRARTGPRRGIALAFAAAALAHADDAGNRYGDYTDAQLTEVAGQWQSLDKEARRDFFIEVRRRMGEQGAAQPIRVRGERRFGQVIRRPDGSVMRIERVIRFKARGSNGRPVPVEYGKGFEQRVAQDAAERPPAKPPAGKRAGKAHLIPANGSGKSSDG